MNLAWPGLLAIGTVIATGWRYFMMLVRYLQQIVVCHAVVGDQTSRAVKRYLLKYGTRSPFGIRVFGGERMFVFPKQRREIVPIEGIPNDPILFWFGKSPLFARLGQRHGNESGGESALKSMVDAAAVDIWYIRGTLDITKIIKAATKEFNDLEQDFDTDKKSKRFAIVRNVGSNPYHAKEIGSPGRDYPTEAAQVESCSTLRQIQRGEVISLMWTAEELVERSFEGTPFTYYPFPRHVHHALKEIKMWLTHEKWFRSKGIPWRRGWLLEGPPGTGKSTLVKSIGMEFDLPVNTFDLATYDNHSFPPAWAAMMSRTPCIALIEDIDTVFHGRENIAVKNRDRDGLTFDCLLNTISGVGNADGVFLVITTNRKEFLDPAIGVMQEDGRSSRPGRIDRIIHLGHMEDPERLKVAQLILADWPDIIEDVVKQGCGDTSAQFQERCAQIAIKKFWELTN